MTAAKEKKDNMEQQFPLFVVCLSHQDAIGGEKGMASNDDIVLFMVHETYNNPALVHLPDLSPPDHW